MPMPPFRRVVLPLLLTTVLPVTPLLAQSHSAPGSTTGTSTALTLEKAIELGEANRCKEALPALKRAASSTSPADLRKKAEILGLRCSLQIDDRDSADAFLQQLHQQFPQDPDILFIVVHAYSDLSTRTAQDLGRTAPQSIAAKKLMAEAFEMQGNWDQAQHTYEEMIQKEPDTPGLHYLLGRSLLSQPNPPPENEERAAQAFQKELEIDPNNAGAHYILGELARKNDKCEEALPQYHQAIKLNSNFAEAHLGAGYCLVTEKKYKEAIAQLRIAEKLMPFNGTVHYVLGTALSFDGQKEEAQKEFAIHREVTRAAAPAPVTGQQP